MDGVASLRLTERQKDCLRLVGQGYTSKEIGRALDLSPSTVDNHILAGVQAVGAMTRGEAARLLASSEDRQKLPRETHTLAEQGNSVLLAATAQPPTLSFFGRQIRLLPPVGGHENDLDATKRTLAIVQVAALGFGTVMSLALIIAGMFRLFR
jgi:DNA-binding CsgD family transcriptional regulator